MNTTRSCATCGLPIQISPRHPNRRYCSPRCRVADWQARNDRPHLPTNENDVPNAVPPGNAATDAVPAGDDAVPAQHTSTCCPHCGRELTVLTWLLPPAAAHVTTPQVPHG